MRGRGGYQDGADTASRTVFDMGSMTGGSDVLGLPRTQPMLLAGRSGDQTLRGGCCWCCCRQISATLTHWLSPWPRRPRSWT